MNAILDFTNDELKELLSCICDSINLYEHSDGLMNGFAVKSVIQYSVKKKINLSEKIRKCLENSP
jgi:hypothetical protein